MFARKQKVTLLRPFFGGETHHRKATAEYGGVAVR
jgi:hypothetical protein